MFKQLRWNFISLLLKTNKLPSIKCQSLQNFLKPVPTHLQILSGAYVTIIRRLYSDTLIA